MMRRRIEKKGESGAVLVEFALAFPILLITFIFAIQLLFVFIYDILGSYAAFAAARSYSTLQDEAVAKGVAAAVMSSWTIPVLGEVRGSGDPPPGVSEFLNAMDTMGMSANIEDAYRCAYARMSDITVETTDAPGIYLKEGFEYSGASSTSRPLGGFFGSFINTISGWVDDLPDWLSWGWDWVVRGLQPKRYQAQVGEVSFSYDFSQSMVFARFEYLGLPVLAGNGTKLFSIYQRCAMPIEPSWQTKNNESDALEGVNHAVNYQQLLRDNNDVITNKLHAVYIFLKEEMGPITGLDPVYATYSFEEFIENSSSASPGRLYRDRSDVDTWSVDNISGNATWTDHNGASHSEQVDWRYVSASESDVPDPLLVVQDMSGAPNGDQIVGGANYDSVQTTDVLVSLRGEDEYRERVIENIDEEIGKARAERDSLITIVGLEQAVCQALDKIRWLEGYIRDGGGWKTDSSWGKDGKWWNPSGWSKTKPPSGLQADKKSVKKTVKKTGTKTNADGSTSSYTYYVKVHDYYKYKRKIKDGAAIAKAIQDQWNSIAKLNQDIVSERQNINYFLEPEENDVVGENNTEDNFGWYDDEKFDAKARISAIIEVWHQRKGTLRADNGVLSGELQRIEENDLVRERFVELMNEALVPIADYYRIQDRMLEDQKEGLNAVDAFSEALK